MANKVWTENWQHNSDANFRLWGLAITAALTDVGMVQTADTGQINWTTVTRAAVNVDAGFQVWRFNDTLQATKPIFLRLNFGTSPYGVGYPRLTAQVGTGTDGAGTLTGAGPVLSIFIGQGAGAASTESWISCDGSALMICFAVDTPNPVERGHTLILERFRDDDGDPNGLGAYLSNGYSGVLGNTTWMVFDFVGGVTPVANSYPPCLLPRPVGPATSWIAADLTVQTFPWLVGTQQILSQSKMIMAYLTVDLPFGIVQAVTHFGAARSYKALGFWGQYRAGSAGAVVHNQYVSQLMWWSD